MDNGGGEDLFFFQKIIFEMKTEKILLGSERRSRPRATLQFYSRVNFFGQQDPRPRSLFNFNETQNVLVFR